MKILWVSDVLPDPNSGAGGTELLMVQQLRQAGHEVQTCWADALPRRIAHGNLHYAFELPFTYARAIRNACRRTAFDIVTVNLGQSYLAARRLRKAGFPGVFVVRSHGLDDHLDETLRWWQESLHVPRPPSLRRLVGRLLAGVIHGHLHKAARLCDGYVVSNSLDARYLHVRHGLSAERIACIAQAPAAAFLRRPAAPMTSDRERRLLCCANYHFAKAPHAAAAAANQLLKQRPDYTLTWICHRDDHDRVRALLAPELGSRIRLLGWMPQEALVHEFDQHGVLIYPPFFDGFGKVFLEAMARGLCVVGTRAGGMVDIIRSGDNGFLCDFNSAEQIVQRVNQWSASLEQAGRLSASAAQTARQYTWERVGAELAAFFHRRLDAKRAPAGVDEGGVRVCSN